MTANGAVPIVEIEAGQQVLSAVDDGLSQDYSSNEVGTKIVVGEAALVQLVLLHEDGEIETINTTDEHPFHVADTNAWTRADQLLIGDELSTISGTAQLQGVLYTTQRVPVYNLSIPGSPTYYVGEHGVWVHNCRPKNWRYSGHTQWPAMPRGAGNYDEFHNFTEIVDKDVFANGIMKQGSDGYLQYDLLGSYNGYDGVFELGGKFAEDGMFIVTHRLFKPSY